MPSWPTHRSNFPPFIGTELPVGGCLLRRYFACDINVGFALAGDDRKSSLRPVRGSWNNTIFIAVFMVAWALIFALALFFVTLKGFCNSFKPQRHLG